MNGIFLTTGFLFFWTLFLLNITWIHDVVTYWTLCFLLLGGSPIAFHTWYKRRRSQFRARFLRSYPLHSNIEVPETIPKEHLESYVKSLERVLDNENDTPNEVLVSGCDLVQPIASSTVAEACGSVKPVVSSTETTGDCIKSCASTEITDDPVKSWASSSETTVSSVKPCVSSLETTYFIKPSTLVTEATGSTVMLCPSSTETASDFIQPSNLSIEATGNTVKPFVSSVETTYFIKPSTLVTEATGSTVKLCASSTETASDFIQPSTLFTEATGCPVKLGDLSTNYCNGFVNSGIASIETKNFVLVDTASMTAEEMVSEPNPSLRIPPLMDELLISIRENMTEVSCSKIKPTTRQYTDSKLIDEQNTSFENQITEICNSKHNSVISTTEFDELQNESKETGEKPFFSTKDSDLHEFDLKSSLQCSLSALPEGSINIIPLEFLYPCLPYSDV